MESPPGLTVRVNVSGSLLQGGFSNSMMHARHLESSGFLNILEGSPIDVRVMAFFYDTVCIQYATHAKNSHFSSDSRLVFSPISTVMLKKILLIVRRGAKR